MSESEITDNMPLGQLAGWLRCKREHTSLEEDMSFMELRKRLKLIEIDCDPSDISDTQSDTSDEE